ncbi:MAG: FxsA family protein [Pirellulales bacterium]|nr:FxsA family protein [Pirellulales bacterium]
MHLLSALGISTPEDGHDVLARLLLLILLVPLVELYVLYKFTVWTGNFPLTLAIVLGTGILGTMLARRQGWRAWTEIQRQLSAGQMPADALQEALLILLAGALLILPGLLSDLAGIALLVPAVRRAVGRMVAARYVVRTTAQATTSGWNPRTNTYDTTFVDAANDEPPRHRVIEVRALEPEESSPRR